MTATLTTPRRDGVSTSRLSFLSALVSALLLLLLSSAATPASAQSLSSSLMPPRNYTRYPYCSYLGQDFAGNYAAPVLNYTVGSGTSSSYYYISMCVDQLANFTGNPLCAGTSVCQCQSNTCYQVAQFDNSPLWSFSPATGANYVQLGSPSGCGMRREVTLSFQCGANYSVISYSEVSICRYQFIISSPLACALSNVGTTGVDIVEDFNYCTFQSRDFYTVTQPAVLDFSLGTGSSTNRYFVSLCVDRLATVTGSTACAGASVCRCTASGTGSCAPLALLNNLPNWVAVSSSSASYTQFGPTTGCGYRRSVTITFQCSTTTSFVSVVEVTACIQRLVFNTPLACGLQLTPPPDITEEYQYCSFLGRDFATVSQPDSLVAVSGTATFFLSMCWNRLANVTGNSQCMNATICQCYASGTTMSTCYRVAEMEDVKTWSLISPSRANFTQLGDTGSCPRDRVASLLFVCGNTTSFTISETATCVYQGTVTTPLACEMALPAVVGSSSTGFANYALDYGYCSYQNQPFAATTQPTVLSITSGGWTYYVSMCVDRLAAITSSVACSGASVCQCDSSSSCTALAQFNNAPVWTSPTASSASYFQLGASSNCGFRRQTSVVFQCGATTALFSVTETSVCVYRLVITTPLACAIANATSADIPDDWSYCTFAGRDFASVTEPLWLSYRDTSRSWTYIMSMCTDRLANATGVSGCANATVCQCNGGSCTRVAEMFDPYTWTFISSNQVRFIQTGASSTGCGGERISTIDFVCGTSNSIVSFTEPTTCQYTGTVSTPLACGLVNPAANSTTGGAGPVVQRYGYCTYQNTNFTSLTASSPLVLTVGQWTYYISMCADRLGSFIPSPTCVGASVCRCTSQLCEALAMFDNLPTWTSPLANAASYLQLGSSVSCGYRRQVTLDFQCNTAGVTFLSFEETTTCIFRAVIRTPLACGVAAVTAPDVPNDYNYCVYGGRDFASVSEPNVLLYRAPSAAWTFFLSMCTDRLGLITGISTCRNATMCQCGTNGDCHPVAEMFDTYSWTYVSPNQVNFVQLGETGSCTTDRVTTIQFVCGETTTINSVTEPSRCVYLANISTPLACNIAPPPLSSSTSVAVLPRSSTAAVPLSSSAAAVVVTPSSSAAMWSSSANDDVNQATSSSSMSSGAIAGAVIGAIVGVIVLLVVCLVLMRSRKNKGTSYHHGAGGDAGSVEMSQAGAHTELEEHDDVHESEAATA